MLGALTVRWNVLLWGPTRTPHFGESQLTLPCFVFHQNCNSCDRHMKNKPSGVIRGKELQKLLIVKVALLQIQGPPVREEKGSQTSSGTSCDFILVGSLAARRHTCSVDAKAGKCDLNIKAK